VSALAERVLCRWIRSAADDEPVEEPEHLKQVYRGLETGQGSATAEKPSGGKLWIEIDNLVRRLIGELPDFYTALGKWVSTEREHFQAGVDEQLRVMDRILSRLRAVLSRIGRAVHELEKVHRDVANEVAQLSSDYDLPHLEALVDACYAKDWARAHKIIEQHWIENALGALIRRIAKMLDTMGKVHEELKKSANMMARNFENVKPGSTHPASAARDKLVLEIANKLAQMKAKVRPEEGWASVFSFVLENYSTGKEKAGYGLLTPQYDQVSGRWVHSKGKSLEEVVQGYAPTLLKIPGVVAVAPGRTRKDRKPVVVVYLSHAGVSDVIPVKIGDYPVRTTIVDDLAPTKKQSVQPVPMLHKGDLVVYEHNVITNPTVWGWWRASPFRDPTLERKPVKRGER